MSLTMTSLLSALVLTYLLSRLLRRVFTRIANPARLVVAHLGSWLLLTGAIGLIKAYFTSLAYQQAAVLILPQLLWFGLDLLRGLGQATPVYGTSTRGNRAR